MANSLITNLGSNLKAVLSTDATSLVAISATLSEPQLLDAVLGSGTGADKANQLYALMSTLAASGSTTLALHALGGATDGLGAAYTIATVKALLIQVLGNLGCLGATALAIVNPGTGGTYAVNDVLTVVGGTGTAATLKVLTVNVGTVLTASVLTAGSYTVAPTNAVSVTGGGGTGATFNLTTTAFTTATAVFVESDYLTIGNAASNAWVSALTGTGTIKLYSGTANGPGTFLLTECGATGWVVAAGSNEQLKIVNNGSNPVAFLVVVVGATA